MEARISAGPELMSFDRIVSVRGVVVDQVSVPHQGVLPVGGGRGGLVAVAGLQR